MLESMRILVVDDDPGISDSLERALRRDGYTVAKAADGEIALAAVAAEPPDAMILDVAMPKLDGLSVCRRLRADGNSVPILVLTARHSLGDRVAGLDAGADDYLVKPFALEELLARLRSILRRAAPAQDAGALAPADLTLDLRTRVASRGGADIELTRTEYQLLELFLRNTGQVLTRELISRFEGSPQFSQIIRLNGVTEIAPVIDARIAPAVLHIGSDFSRRLNAGVPAQI